MKRIALLTVALAAMGCTSEKVKVATEQRATEVVGAAFNTDGAPTVAFSVPDMMCADSCVPTVEKTLASQPGVKDVEVDLDSKTATVAVDESAFDADKAVAALVDLQFTETKKITADEAAMAKADAKADAKAAAEHPADDQADANS